MRTKYILTAVLSLLLWCVPSQIKAQVDKRVEVTKDYVPVVSGAMKLPITPDMADTVKMRPEIDYGITPLMYSPELVPTHSFKPATVTYWDFNRPTNFYLKMGLGYPVNTVGDFYVSTYNVRTGYLMAAANHYGEFGKRHNWFDDSRNGLRSSTRARVAGGAYLGKRMFEGELAYGSEIGRRYAAPLWFYTSDTNDVDPAYKAEYEDFSLKLRIGDDFQDLSHTNFNIGLFGDFFHDKSDWLAQNYKLQQFDYGLNARVGRSFQRHYVEADLRFNAVKGIKDLNSKDNTLWAGLRYGYSARVLDLLLGGDYCWDKSDESRSYFLPYLKLLLNVTDNGAFIPFVEVEGALAINDYYSLARNTVYVGYTDEMAALPNTLTYNFRAGFTGKFGNGRFGYRLYAGLSLADNDLFWYNYNYEWLRAVAGKSQTFTLNLEMDYRPIDELTVSAGIHGRFFSDEIELDGTEMDNGRSPVDAYLKFRYTHRKFSLGASARYVGAADWTCVQPANYVLLATDSFPLMTMNSVKMPGYVDLGIEFEWNLKEDWKIFVEGSNLANMKIYNLAYFREQGIRCTAGFKFTF